MPRCSPVWDRGPDGWEGDRGGLSDLECQRSRFKAWQKTMSSVAPTAFFKEHFGYICVSVKHEESKTD